VSAAKRSLGQNFLVDRAAADRFARAVAAGPDHRVLEVGPGRGALTEPLLQRLDAGGQLVLIEKDDALAASLRERHLQDPRVVVRNEDILRVDLGALARQGPWRVAGNLPFNVAGRIAMALLEARGSEGQPLASRMVLGFQREVARRLCAGPGDSVYGAVSVLRSALGSAQALFDLPPEAYRPRPKVWSGIVALIPHEAPRVPLHRWASFRALVHAAFRHRRKTLANSLKPYLLQHGVGDLRSFLPAHGIDARRRAQELSLEDYLRLMAALPQAESAPRG
jgi:16S rRNA (adenine1518-N6/adenine1519-N6)-dimethyltransferase